MSERSSGVAVAGSVAATHNYPNLPYCCSYTYICIPATTVEGIAVRRVRLSTGPADKAALSESAMSSLFCVMCIAPLLVSMMDGRSNTGGTRNELQHAVKAARTVRRSMVQGSGWVYAKSSGRRERVLGACCGWVNETCDVFFGWGKGGDTLRAP